MLRTVQEWGYLPIRDEGELGGEGATREQADRLLGVATTAARRLGVGDGGVLADGRRALRAQQVIGVIPAAGMTLEILPKIDGLNEGGTRASLISMLAGAWDVPVDVGAAARLGHQKQSLLESLISLFCRQLFAAVHRGLPRRYKAQEGDLPMLRGQMNVHRQFTRLAVSPQRLACRFDELDADIALNRIFRSAVATLGQVARSYQNQRLLAELALAYADVSLVPAGQLPWEEVRHQLDRTNRTWHPLLRFAELLLRRQYQTTSSGEVDGFALLFEMNRLFEAFVGQELRRALRPHGFSVTLQGPPGYALRDLATNANRFMTKPDICIARDGQPAWIIDTKWKQLTAADDAKRGIQQSDVYQMMAYAQVYQVDRLMLLYPYYSGLGSQPGIIANFCLNGMADRRLYIGTVNLSDIRSVRGQLSTMLLGAECNGSAAMKAVG